MSPHSKSQIGAVILAAGGSSRFERPKQLVRFRGKTLVRGVVDAASEAGCSPVVVVVGSDSERIRGSLKSARIVVAENESWRRGIGTSIRTGVDALIKEARTPNRPRAKTTKANSVSRQRLESRPSLEAIVILTCDQPFVNADTIRNLIALRQATKKSIIASSYADTLGVPALFDRSLFPELLSLGDKGGAKSIISRNRNRVERCPLPQGEIDIDTREDWEKLKSTESF